jgi:hypothetical protein
MATTLNLYATSPERDDVNACCSSYGPQQFDLDGELNGLNRHARRSAAAIIRLLPPWLLLRFQKPDGGSFVGRRPLKTDDTMEN